MAREHRKTVYATGGLIKGAPKFVSTTDEYLKQYAAQRAISIARGQAINPAEQRARKENMQPLNAHKNARQIQKYLEKNYPKK